MFNLLKPAYYIVQSSSNSEWMFARKSDATIWRRQVQTSSVWSSVGKPSTGATSGPEFGSMRINAAKVIGWIIVTTANGIFGLPNGEGTTWVKLCDLPPGGVTSGPAVSFSNEMESLHVVVRGSQNIPFIAAFSPGATSTTLTFNGWQQVGTMQIDSAPGAAETSWRIDVLGLVGTRIKLTTCQYPSCFGTWVDDVAGDARQSPSAYWMPGTTNDGPWLAISVLGTDSHPYLKKYDNFGDTWGGWADKGGGSTFDAAVAIGYMTNTPQQGRLSTHNGNSFFFDPGAVGFNNVGAP